MKILALASMLGFVGIILFGYLCFLFGQVIELV